MMGLLRGNPIIILEKDLYMHNPLEIRSTNYISTLACSKKWIHLVIL